MCPHQVVNPVRAFSCIVKPSTNVSPEGSGQEESHEIKAAAVSRAFSSHNSWEECKRSTGRGSVSKPGGSRNAAILSTTPPRWATSCDRPVGAHRRTHPVARRLSHGIRHPATAAHGTLLQAFGTEGLWAHVALRFSEPFSAIRHRWAEHPQSQQNGLLQLPR